MSFVSKIREKEREQISIWFMWNEMKCMKWYGMSGTIQSEQRNKI